MGQHRSRVEFIEITMQWRRGVNITVFDHLSLK
jgi:hypothetical protein